MHGRHARSQGSGPQGLSPEAVTALAAQMIEHIEQQTKELENKAASSNSSKS
jgi:hypothetical protein